MRLSALKKGEGSGEKRIRCSFCGKSKDDAAQLIAGPSVYICNECVDLCTRILAEHAATQS